MGLKSERNNSELVDTYKTRNCSKYSETAERGKNIIASIQKHRKYEVKRSSTK